MARRRKVDPVLLEKLLRDGFSQEEVAQKLKVSPGTISKNKKALDFARANDIVLRSASKINDKKLNAMSRLDRIADIVEGELAYIQGVIKNTQGQERREWQEVQLKHTAEIRKQVSLLREIALTLYNVEEVEAFKKIVLEEIGEVNHEVRQKILDRIRQRRTDTGLSVIGGLGV